MIGASLRLAARWGGTWLAHSLAVLVLLLLAACGNEQELWSDTAAPDRIPSFRQVSPSDLNALALAPPNAVIAVGDNGTIMRSTDQGRQWSAVSAGATDRALQHVISAPGGTVVAVGEGGTIVRSRDGGATWTAIRNTGTDKTLRRILALSPAVLVAVGDEATIVRSADGGDSWSPVYGSDSVTLWDVASADGQRLVAVGNAGVIVRSSDGGQSWTPVARLGGALRDVHVTRSGALVAVGAGVARADNMAAPWSEVKVPMTGTLGLEHMPFSQVIETPGATLVAFGAGATHPVFPRRRKDLDPGRDRHGPRGSGSCCRDDGRRAGGGQPCPGNALGG